MLMTPGPTEVPERVRNAMARPIQNPDMDEDFFDFYHDLEEKVKEVYQTKDDVIVLGGEGILGLEASIASTIEEGDKVLCISNGIYGEGFADFVEMYGGEPVLCDFPYGERIDPEAVKDMVEDEDFEVATMVHCETPTGTINEIEGVLSVLEDEGIITVVDAVSSLGGTQVPVSKIDICIGGSQKCFSAPPGLTTLSVSEKAWNTIMDKEQDTFYCNLGIWKQWFDEEYFPYTHSVSNLYALDEAFNMILEEGLVEVFRRHEKSARRCREMAADIGLSFYPSEESLNSPTVTALHVEDRAKELQERMREDHDILLATSLGDLQEDILRIGHMGYNADIKKVERVMKALSEVVTDLGL